MKDMYINKSEYEKLKQVSYAIRTTFNLIIEIPTCDSIIVGHDIRAEISRIENYLNTAMQSTETLLLAYQKNYK